MPNRRVTLEKQTSTTLIRIRHGRIQRKKFPVRERDEQNLLLCTLQNSALWEYIVPC